MEGAEINRDGIVQMGVSYVELNYFIGLVVINLIESGMQGLKRKRRCQIECKDHLFSIQCLKPNSSKYDAKLLFCPKFQRDPLPPEFIHPEFNTDFKYYTSAFILGVDKRVLLKNEQQEIMDHQKQIRDSLQKHNQLIFPRPNSKHTHCSVCKESYKNYYFHISTEEHREKIAVSFYNFHIKEVCRIYSHLWEGAEERADEQAERLAQEEEERRQKMSELVQDAQQQSSLLDVQRGEVNQFFQDRQEEAEEQQDKSSKKMSRPLSINDDTVPLRQYKRSAPSGRTYQSEYLRKKFHNNMVSSQRMRQQKRYQREREKVKTDRDNQPNKELIKINQKEGDTFIIMKASYAIAQGHGEFIWKRSSKNNKEIQKINHVLENREKSQISPERQNKTIQIHFDKEAEVQKKLALQKKQQEKFKYPNYPPYPHHHQNYKVENHYGSKKHHQYRPHPQPKNASQPYKQPYYYNPYPHYDHYPRDKSCQYPNKQKQRHKPGEKEYDYSSMPYQWPYHHPYYMPQPIPPTQNPHEQPIIPNPKAVANQAGPSYPAGSTNININFPMYMCPPPHSSYPASNPTPPMNPYMGYQYPYVPHPHSQPQHPNQPNIASREPSHLNPPQYSGYAPPQGYPHNYKQQPRNNQAPKPPPNSQPLPHQPYQYMHHYPPYQYPPPSQFQGPPQQPNSKHSKF